MHENFEKEYADLLCLYNDLSEERKHVIQLLLRDLKALTEIETK